MTSVANIESAGQYVARALTTVSGLPRARPGLAAAENARRLNALIDDVARDSRGFTGGDGWHGTVLADGTSVWSLGDTIIGGVQADGTRLNNAGRPHQFVRTSVIVDDGERVSTLVGPDELRATGRGALLEPPGTQTTTVATLPIPDRWYWPSAVVDSGDGVDLVMQQWLNKTSELRWDWELLGTDVIRLDAKRHVIQGVRSINDDGGRVWGAAHLRDGEHTYMYGVTNDPIDKRLVVARAQTADIGAPWEYRSSTGWSKDPAEAEATIDGFTNQFAAIRTRDGVALLSQENLGNELLVHRAATPAGPFRTTGERLALPEPMPNTHHYSSVVHPQLSDESELLVVSSRAPSHGPYEPDYRWYLPHFATVPRPR